MKKVLALVLALAAVAASALAPAPAGVALVLLWVFNQSGASSLFAGVGGLVAATLLLQVGFRVFGGGEAPTIEDMVRFLL